MKTDEIKVVARNRKATFEYLVEETLEAGLVLTGTEVKSLRDSNAQLVDAYAAIDSGEAFLHQLHIGEYPNAAFGNHEPRRVRKLLLKKAEIVRLLRKVEVKGMTLIPLEIYFKQGRAKVKLGLCKGKKAHDKRASIKSRDVARDIDRDE